MIRTYNGVVRKLTLLPVLVLLLALAGCVSMPAPEPLPVVSTPVVCPLGPACPNQHYTPGEVDPDAALVGYDSDKPKACFKNGPGRDSRRQISDKDWRVVMAQYEITAATKVEEKDHLVAHWAGGMSTVKNVWPQLDAQSKTKKDRMEAALYRMVCLDHTLDLHQAQERMKTFWDDPLY